MQAEHRPRLRSGRGFNLKAGITTIALRRYDVFHSLDLAAEVGLSGVELWGKPPHTPEEFDEDYLRRVRDRARSNGLKVHMFGSYVRPVLPDFAEKSESALKAAKILGARRIRVWAGNKEPKEADAELWTLVSDSLREFALRAEDQGMTLAVEMHGGTLAATPEGSLRLLETVAAPNLKLNFQVVDYADPDLDRTVAMIGDHVVNVHAQNYRPSSIDKDKMELCLISEGVVDYDHLAALLVSRGFKGFFEVEFLKGENISEQIMLESLKKDAAYLTELAAKHTSSEL
jgi:sugar phosphate isomerase/epimerase